jgi:two-component system osmolarity sensor histidine kinase EnvZ
MRWGLPQSLFGRTAALIAAILCVFSFIVYTAVMWAVVVPSADLTAEVLAQRAQVALSAQRSGAAAPQGASWSSSRPRDIRPRLRALPYGAYLDRLCDDVRAHLNAVEVVMVRARAPAQIGIRFAADDERWLTLSIRLARPETPWAFLTVLSVTVLLVLVVSAWSTRRLTTPLARLAQAASRIAGGEIAPPIPASGPSEVRSLAQALQSMSHRLAELNEERELMLAGISHDLRSPLARIRVALELVGDGNAVLVQQMSGEVEEMDRMIGVFLHYVRAGYRESPVMASLDDVVRKALTPFAHDARVTFQPGAAAKRPLHAEAIGHIAFNLVHNALDHGRPPVQVITAADTSQVRLVVRDAGPGVDPMEWQEALRPFSRLRAAPGHGHAGLGLALVDRLVRAARGTVTAQRDGDGFRIVIALPASTSLDMSGEVSELPGEQLLS